MGISAFPYTAVLDVSANSLLGNNTGSPAASIALTATQVRTLLSVYTSAQVDALLANYQPLDSDLTAIAALTTTAFGRSLLTQTDGAATRTTIGAGTSSFSGAYGDLSGIPATFTPASHTHAAADITSGVIATARLASSGTADATTFLRGDQTWATVSAGVGGSTGSVDNAMLRADGTGGSTVQASNWITTDNYTASPNNTVNHASLQATGGTTNVSVSIVPKGSGAFSLHVPDGTSTGGNARGANAVDLRTAVRAAATNVASGSQSFLGPNGVSATNTGSVAFGGTASGQNAVCLSSAGTASGAESLLATSTAATSCSGTRAVGFSRDGGTQTGASSFGQGNIPGWGSGNVDGSGAIGFCGAESTATTSKAFGYYASANRYGMNANANGAFTLGGFGESQRAEFVARNKTTGGTTAVTLFLDGSSSRLTIPSGKVLHATVLITGSKSDGSAVAVYMRQVAIKNVGGTTSLVGTVNTLGTDTAAGTSIAITADDTNDALQIAVTGVASETWRWTAVVYGVELAYGT